MDGWIRMNIITQSKIIENSSIRY